MHIEKNIPIPEAAGKTGRPTIYPFKDMSVGDSLFFPDEPKGSQSNPAAASKHATRRDGPCEGWRFVARSIDGGVRIWRQK